MRHLVSIEDLDRDAIERIVALATNFGQVADRPIKKLPSLRGRLVINLFYEASTRTRSSFELAAKRLSADVVNFAASGSSVEKGESLFERVAVKQCLGGVLVLAVAGVDDGGAGPSGEQGGRAGVGRADDDGIGAVGRERRDGVPQRLPLLDARTARDEVQHVGGEPLRRQLE